MDASCKKHPVVAVVGPTATGKTALGVALAGDAVYFGKTVKKPFIGDARRRVEAEDIVRANRLLYVSAGIIWLAGLLLRWTLCGGWGL